jgi:hypothetical protein
MSRPCLELRGSTDNEKDKRHTEKGERKGDRGGEGCVNRRMMMMVRGKVR